MAAATGTSVDTREPVVAKSLFCMSSILLALFATLGRRGFPSPRQSEAMKTIQYHIMILYARPPVNPFREWADSVFHLAFPSQSTEPGA
jgi:hypothetical protein